MADPHSIGGRAPLRAADWRFLLPHPPGGQFQLLIVLGGPASLAERIIEVGLARDVSDTIPNGRSADAVVMLHGARAELREIAGCLVPGGVLYYEVDRRSLGFLASTPERIRRSIRKAGLLPTALYAVVPDFSDHRMYLPLDVPGALRWYVTALYNAFTPWQRLAETALRAVTSLDGRRFARFAPRLAFTAVAGEHPPGPPSVLEHQALPPELQGHDLQPLLLTHGGDRVVILPFAADSMQPIAVLKVPRLPAFNGRTENEQATLHELWSRIDPAIRSGIPRPLGTVRFGEVIVSIESYARGQMLSRSSERWGASRHERVNDLRLAAAWLGEFHRQSEVSRPSWEAFESSQWVEGPLAAYRRAFGVTAEEEQLFADAREYATSLTGMPLPIVLQHRDFTVWNISRCGRELAVLDWEGSRPGPALCDLLHFVTHWYEAVRHAHDEGARQRCFHRLFFEFHRGDQFCEAGHLVIAQYMERLNMDRRFLPLLLVYTWVELGLRRLDQQRLQEEMGPDPRDGNRYLAFVAILAEHSERLFGEDVRGGGGHEPMSPQLLRLLPRP